MIHKDDITQLLRAASKKKGKAADVLFPLVYDELRRLAQHYLRREQDAYTLSATALVHEAYIKLVDQTRAQFADRAHFFAVAAQAMRRILVDRARGKKRRRRGGGEKPIALHEVDTIAADDAQSLDLVALDIALTRLAEIAPEKARVVEMRVFAGLSTAEVAEVLGVTARTVRRYWDYSQTWLYRELHEGGMSR